MENPEEINVELLASDVEVVSTWKESRATRVKIHTLEFTLRSISDNLKEVSHLIKGIRSDEHVHSILLEIQDLTVKYEEQLNLIHDEISHDNWGAHYGGIYTFFKLVAICWVQMIDRLTVWKESQQQLLPFLPITVSLSRIGNTIASLFTASLSPTATRYRTATAAAAGPTPPPTLPSPRPSSYLHDVLDRQRDLVQLSALLPLMLLILKEKKKAGTDHIKLFDVEEAERIPTVIPFWYKYNTNLQRFRELLYGTYVTVSESSKVPDSLRRYAVTIATAIQCTFDREEMSRKGHEVYNNSGDIAMLQRIWNLPDTPFISTFMTVTLPRVAVSQKITITAPNEGFLKGPIQARLISAKSLPFTIDHLINPATDSYVQSLSRVISANSLTRLFSGFFVDGGSTPCIPLVLHFHGGGFVSGSSAMHEFYLREWAIQTGLPILSVDYKLAPEFKFPTGLEECYHVYKWLMTTCKLGMKVKKIALVGDSAGGNIASGVVYKAIEEGIPLPDGLVMQYPALDMCATSNASRLLFKNDPLVPLGVMNLCRKAYLPRKNPFNDASTGTETGNIAGVTELDESYVIDEELLLHPLVSPIHVPDEVLAQYPPVYLCCGDFDPLLDENIVYARKLKKLGKLVKFKIYEGMPHGYLSIADKNVPEANVTIRDAGNWISQIVS